MRDQIAAMNMFLWLAPQMEIDPPLSMCDTLADYWNKNPDTALFVANEGSLVIGDKNDKVVTDTKISNGRREFHYWYIADREGIRPGDWPPEMVAALKEAAYKYGIPGVS